MNDEVIARTTDPDSREVVFDENARSHLNARRPDLLQYVDVILAAISLPDYRTLDPEGAASASIDKASSTAGGG